MSQYEILDPHAIEALRSLSPDGDSAFLRELIDIYLQDTPKQMAELQDALAKQDVTRVIRAAHTIKGSSGNFGAARFANVAKEIEAHGKAHDLAAAAVGQIELKRQYELVVEELKKIDQGT